MGRKNCITIGMVVLTISTFAFGMAAYFPDVGTFYVVSMIGRGFQGIGDAMVSIAVPSIIAIEFPKDNEKYQGWSNMALGFGLMIGPALGAMFYAWFGYQGSFYVFVGLLFLFGVVGVLLIPQRINKNKQIRDIADEALDQAEKEKKVDRHVSWMAFFKNRRSFISLITTFMGMLAIFYLDPTLSIRLEEFGVKDSNVGYFFAIEGFAFAVGSPITGWLCSKFDRRAII
jgi:MFS family permease